MMSLSFHYNVNKLIGYIKTEGYIMRVYSSFCDGSWEFPQNGLFDGLVQVDKFLG